MAESITMVSLVGQTVTEEKYRYQTGLLCCLLILAMWDGMLVSYC